MHAVQRWLLPVLGRCATIPLLLAVTLSRVPGLGVTSCELCPSGRSTSKIGTDVCPEVSLARSMSSRTDQLAFRALVQCRPGTYSNSTGFVQCTECERGKFIGNPGRTACQACARGDYQKASLGLLPKPRLIAFPGAWLDTGDGSGRVPAVPRGLRQLQSAADHLRALQTGILPGKQRL